MFRLNHKKKKNEDKEYYLRLDDRLIHGQVVQGWIPFLGADTIVVVNDKIASDELQQKILSLSVPPGIKVFFIKQENLSEKLQNIDGHKILILFDSLNNIIEASQKLKITKINLGNYHPGKTPEIMLSKFFQCTKEEYDKLKRLSDEGIEIEIKNLPGQKGKTIKNYD